MLLAGGRVRTSALIGPGPALTPSCLHRVHPRHLHHFRALEHVTALPCTRQSPSLQVFPGYLPSCSGSRGGPLRPRGACDPERAPLLCTSQPTAGPARAECVDLEIDRDFLRSSRLRVITASTCCCARQPGFRGNPSH